MPLTIENKRDKTLRNGTIYFSKITKILKGRKGRSIFICTLQMPSWTLISLENNSFWCSFLLY